MKMKQLFLFALLVIALGGATGAAGAEVTGFVLWDADTDTVLFDLEDGDTVALSVVGNSLNIEAVCPACVPGDRVSLNLTGATERHKTEGVAPYFLAGDSGGNVLSMALNVGMHEMEAHVLGGGGLTIDFEVVAGPTTVSVDCDAGDSIQQALEAPGEELIIEISGLCQERVVITRDHVTLIGSDPDFDGVTGPALDDPVVQRALVRVLDAKDVRLENLTVTASELRGIEADNQAVVEVVNCRVVGNGNRGIQANDGATANVFDTVIEDNPIGLIIFSTGQISCTNCTVDSSSFAVGAFNGRYIDLRASTVLTSGSIAAYSVASTIYLTNTDVTGSLLGVYSSENAELSMTGGELEGSVLADWTSLVVLTNVTQTVNPFLNQASENSHLRIFGGSLVGETNLTGFSNSTAEGAASFEDVTCDRGGDLYCDGTVTTTSSTCALCPSTPTFGQPNPGGSCQSRDCQERRQQLETLLRSLTVHPEM